MATKKELEKEIKHLKTGLATAENGYKEAQEARSQLFEENQSLKSSAEQASDTINMYQKETIRQQAKIDEMQKCLDKSWDKKTAEEVIEVFLREMPIN